MLFQWPKRPVVVFLEFQRLLFVHWVIERLLVFGFLGFSFDGEYGTQHQYAYQLPS